MTTKELVKQIHGEFDAEYDAIVQKAMEILNPTPEDEKLTDALKSAGFKNCQNVKKMEALNADNALYEKGLYYKQKYPLLQFITEDAFFGICKKYGLVYAPAENYTGNIPEKNAKEIVNSGDFDMDDARIKFVIRSRLNGREDLIEKETYEYMLTSKFDSDLLRYVEPKSYHEECVLHIAADESQFNLGGMEKNGLGYSKKAVVYPDPVVFRFVDGGILIVSKWGDEANDPELNVNNNETTP
jgi:hypothetical protein